MVPGALGWLMAWCSASRRPRPPPALRSPRNLDDEGRWGQSRDAGLERHVLHGVQWGGSNAGVLERSVGIRRRMAAG